MRTEILQLIRRHQRAISVVLVALVVLAGALASARPWSTSGGRAPTDLITTLTDSCRFDPAHLSAAPAGVADYLHTCSTRIYDAQGTPFHIVGVSWFGIETANEAPDGLWARNWQSILHQIVALGYNTIRLPYSNDIFKAGAMPSGINYLINPDLQGLTPLQIMDKMVDGAHQRGLRILLDDHRPTSAGQSDLWYTPEVPESMWIADWVFLAQRYANTDTVLGADLHNEPRGPATWGTNDLATDWRLAAQRAGDAILAVNPRWLIFIEGIEKDGSDWYWWGGNLIGVGRAQVILNVSNRVVYSPHDYGPDVYPQGWFQDPSFPANLPGVWDRHWGFIEQQGIAPVVLGEFGGRSVGSDPAGRWQNALVNYVRSQRIGYISWALNPDSGDTGGILQSDWLTVAPGKSSLYTQGQATPSAGSAAASTTPPKIRLTYHAAGTDPSSTNVSFEISLFNDGGLSEALSDFDIRYWFAADPSLIQATIDWALLGQGHVTVNVVPKQCGDQNGYLDFTFDTGSGPILGYGTTGPILVRYHRSDWGPLDPTLDHGYGASTVDQPWPNVQILKGSDIIWGQALSC